MFWVSNQIFQDDSDVLSDVSFADITGITPWIHQDSKRIGNYGSSVVAKNNKKVSARNYWCKVASPINFKMIKPSSRKKFP